MNLAGDEAIILQTAIHSAQKKDLLIGVSLRSGLYTDTTVKEKNGSAEKAGAEAGVLVWIEIDGAAVHPSQVVFNHRIQELNATLGGVIKSCTVNLVDYTGDDGVGDIPDGIPDYGEFNVIEDCYVTDEEIGLILNTTSANHFNFVAPNMGSGSHTVKVWAKALSSAAFLNGFYVNESITTSGDCVTAGGEWVEVETDVYDCRFGTTDNHAEAWAIVNLGSLTVEEVRDINQLEDGIDLD